MVAAIAWILALLSVFADTQARKGFWDYFSQSSGDKGMMGQQQKLARESLKDSFEQDLSNVNKFLEKLGPLSGSGKEPPLLAQDPVGMRQRLQEELEEVRARLEPYMAAEHELVGWNLESLRRKLKPYTVELMEQVGLRVQELQEQLRVVGEDTKAQLLGGVDEALSLLQEMQSRVMHHTGRMKELFHPYAERLVTGIGHHVQELHRSVAPHAAASPARLSRCVQMLSHKLTLKAQALHTSIQQNLDQLQIAAFTHAIDQETEEVQQQLAPPPPGHSAFAPEFGHPDSSKALSKLQTRLDNQAL